MDVKEKVLIALDFDHTIIDKNSDVVITELAPNNKIPKHIKQQLTDDPDGWTPYMRSIFKFLFENGVKQNDYFKCLEQIPFVTGIKELLLACHERGNCEVIILSDSNSLFINYILRNAGLLDTVNKVFTNCAYFDENNCLQINEYHMQNWCPFCARNICKGWILDTYIQKRRADEINFIQCSYIGDGSNDICPSLKLKSNDFLFPRKGYKLMKQLDKFEKEISATVIPWKTGSDILKVLFKS